MKILFFGLGSIGKRHAKLLLDNFDHELFAFRSNENASKNELEIPEIHELSEIGRIGIDVAFITNPTSEHMKYAKYCAEHGIDLFIEKPLTDKLGDAEEFTVLAKKNKTNVYVAYCLRFHPVISWLKEHLKDQKPIHASVYCSSYLPLWRPGQDHLKGYSANKAMGGGALLDLSHEVDYLFYFFGKPDSLVASGSRASNVTVDSDDFLDAIIQFPNTTCNLHLDFFSHKNRRDILLDFPTYSVFADLFNNRVELIKEGKSQVIELPSERNEVFLKQLNYFFGNLGKKEQMNGLDEAMEVFEIIMHLKKEAEK